MKNIWTNGCFDIVHLGHMALFEYARSLGDKLIVGIDSDSRIKQLKGEHKPFFNESYRRSYLSHIKHINEIVIFHNEQELIDSLQKYDIATIVVGDDYRNKRVVGREQVKEVLFFSKIPNLSSSKLYESFRRS